MTSAVLSKLRALVTGTARAGICELCARRPQAEHQHLLEPEARRVLRTCSECALASHETQGPGARYLRVERRALRLTDVDFLDSDWGELRVPMGIAFFTSRHRTGEVVATFPGRSGLIETFVPLRAWGELERRFPLLTGILPEVEALLVRRSARHRDYFLVSIDHCYELAELLRSSGAPAASHEVAPVQAFFSHLEARAGQQRPTRRPGA